MTDLNDDTINNVTDSIVDTLTDYSSTNSQDSLMDKINAEFDALENLQQQIDQLEQQIDQLEQQMEPIEEQLAADLDEEFNRYDSSTRSEDDMSGCCNADSSN